jgi:hypothetical protein
VSPVWGVYNYGPDTISAFDVRYDNIRIRAYAFPEPYVQVGSETRTTTLAVRFGGKPCLALGTVTPRIAVCVIPPPSPGTVDITLTNPGGNTFTLPGAFTYEPGESLYLPMLRR